MGHVWPILLIFADEHDICEFVENVWCLLLSCDTFALRYANFVVRDFCDCLGKQIPSDYEFWLDEFLMHDVTFHVEFSTVDINDSVENTTRYNS